MAGKDIMVGTGAGITLTALALSVATPQVTNLEGSKSVAYRDVAGVLTVCNGHTGKDIVVGKVYDAKECEALTAKDAQKAVDGVLSVSPHLVWHPMQLAAAVSFSYNIGITGYKNSTVAKLFNQGDLVGGCKFLANYKYANGKVVPGLITRRDQEIRICMSTLTPEGLSYVKHP